MLRETALKRILGEHRLLKWCTSKKIWTEFGAEVPFQIGALERRECGENHKTKKRIRPIQVLFACVKQHTKAKLNAYLGQDRKNSVEKKHAFVCFLCCAYYRRHGKLLKLYSGVPKGKRENYRRF